MPVMSLTLILLALPCGVLVGLMLALAGSRGPRWLCYWFTSLA